MPKWVPSSWWFDHDSDVIIKLAQENTATHQSVTANAGYVCSVIACKFIFQSLVVILESPEYPRYPVSKVPHHHLCWFVLVVLVSMGLCYCSLFHGWQIFYCTRGKFSLWISNSLYIYYIYNQLTGLTKFLANVWMSLYIWERNNEASFSWNCRLTFGIKSCGVWVHDAHRNGSHEHANTLKTLPTVDCVQAGGYSPCHRSALHCYKWT